MYYTYRIVMPARHTLSQHVLSFLPRHVFCTWSWFYIHLSAALGEDEHAHCWWQHSPLHVHADGSHTHRPGYQTGIRCVLTSWPLSSTPVHLCFYSPLWHSTSMPFHLTDKPWSLTGLTKCTILYCDDLPLSSGVLAQRLCDADLKREINKVWPSLSSKTVDLLVTPHKRKPRPFAFTVNLCW